MKLIVCDNPSITKLRVTLGAAEYWLFPDWEAVIEQLPGASGETAFPEILHTLGVPFVKVTESPEEAFAEIDCDPSVDLIFEGWLKSIVCVFKVTKVKIAVPLASLYTSSSAIVTRIRHVPFPAYEVKRFSLTKQLPLINS